MRLIKKLISSLRRQRPVLLVISICAGMIGSPLAHLGYGLSPLSALFLTMCHF